MERTFTSYVLEGTEEIVFPSTSDAHSKAHKIFVRGSLLFSAVDGDLDGYLGADNGEDLTTLNKPEFEESEDESGESAVTDRHDFAYYYLDNARGQVMALVARDAVQNVFPPESEAVTKARILEYYRYNAFGSVTVLPVYDRDDSDYSHVESTGAYSYQADDIPGSGSRSDWDLIENTPLDLSDNNTLMHNRRTGSAGHALAGGGYGRAGAWGNEQIGASTRCSADAGIQFQTGPAPAEKDAPTPQEVEDAEEEAAKGKKPEDDGKNEQPDLPPTAGGESKPTDSGVVPDLPTRSVSQPARNPKRGPWGEDGKWTGEIKNEKGEVISRVVTPVNMPRTADAWVPCDSTNVYLYESKGGFRYKENGKVWRSKVIGGETVDGAAQKAARVEAAGTAWSLMGTSSFANNVNAQITGAMAADMKGVTLWCPENCPYMNFRTLHHDVTWKATYFSESRASRGKAYGEVANRQTIITRIWIDYTVKLVWEITCATAQTGDSSSITSTGSLGNRAKSQPGKG